MTVTNSKKNAPKLQASDKLLNVIRCEAPYVLVEVAKNKAEWRRLAA